MKRIFCLIMILISLLSCGCSAAEDAAGDPAVVRVGDTVYPLSVVQFAYTSSLDVVSLFSGEVSDEDRQTLLTNTIERMIGIGVIENKLKELGQYEFTEDELNTLEYSARQQYEKTWQKLYTELHREDSSITEEEVTSWLTGEGYTVDAFYREALVNERQFRMISLYCDDVLLTQSEVSDFYMKTYVEPDRERYEQDIGRYESEILATDSEAFFVPEGYRYIKQIQLALPDDMMHAMKPFSLKVQNTLKKAQEDYLALAEAAAGATSMEDIAEPQAAYKESRAAFDAASEAYLEKLQEALPMVKETTDLIYARYRGGASFEDLIGSYSIDTTRQSADDPGFPFHPDSANWPSPVHDALAALTRLGELSEPVVTDEGIYIFCYMGDVPAGVHVLTDEEQKAVENAAVYAAQLEKLTALVQEWQKEYDVEVHPELISLE